MARWLVVALMLGGCSSRAGSAGGDTSSSGSTEQTNGTATATSETATSASTTGSDVDVEAQAHAECEALLACGCTEAVSLEQCLAVREEVLGAAAQFAANAGLVWDQDCADSRIAYFRASCELPFDWWPFCHGLACDYFHLPPGEGDASCSSTVRRASDCEPDSICLNYWCEPTCQIYAPRDGCQTLNLTNLKWPSAFWVCPEDQVCWGDLALQCTPGLPDGELCGSPFPGPCTPDTSYCNLVNDELRCEPKLAVGEACDIFRDGCLAGMCIDGTCQPLPSEIGAPCGPVGQCGSGLQCLEDRCEPHACQFLRP